MITLENVGLSIVVVKGEMVFPGKTVDVPELTDAFKRLIAEGYLEVMENRKATKAIVEEVTSKKKAKKEHKTVDEAENGGEYK